ncbi:MAG TPA: rhodanese-like domain-containing protein, partial [Phycisphaerales bacterium]|nr:rhodanese-like domain-containing protein [Phycisphaerales bacterium]
MMGGNESCGCGGSGCSGAGGNASQLEISPQETKKMMDSGTEFLLMDCRKIEEWEESRIEGAKLIPMDELSMHIEQLRAWEDKDI